MTVQAAFSGSQAVFLDTAPAIYAFEADSPFNATALRAVAYCVTSGISILVSPVTLAEGLAGEVDLLRQIKFYSYLTAPELKMGAIDAHVAEVAANLRRTTRLKLPDCLQLATALVAGCDTFLTNDAQLAKTPVNLRFVLVSDFT